MILRAIKRVINPPEKLNRQINDQLGVLMLGQIVKAHEQQKIIFPTCDILAQQEERILRQAADLGLRELNSIEALTERIERCHDEQ